METGLMLKYFVLKPEGVDVYAEASRLAMMTYADHIEEYNPKFADEIREHVDFVTSEY